MTQIQIPSAATYVPVARSFLYKSLSVALGPPTRDNHAALRDGRFMNELWDKLSLIGYLEELLPERATSIRRVTENLSKLPYEELEASYVFCFEQDAEGRSERPSTEAEPLAHEGQDRGFSVEVRKYYDVFGLSMENTGTPWNDPDHLALKLSFLHYLTLKEFQAGSHGNKEKALDYLEIQRGFLEKHLLNRLSLFLARLQSPHPAAAVYLELTRIASEFVRRDIDWILSRIEAELLRSDTDRQRVSSRASQETLN